MLMNIISYFFVLLVSMLPLIELRGAIPYATAMGLNVFLSYIIAVLGNLIVAPFVYFFAQKFLNWGKDKKFFNKFCTFCIKKGEKGGKKLQEKFKDNTYLALFAFVAIPLPGTGVWTGTLAASILELDFRKSLIAISCGLICAATIMQLASSGAVGIFNFLNH